MYFTKRSLLLVPLISVICFSLPAQNFYIPVFQDLTGQELIDSIQKKYKTFSLLTYSTCRDTLFSKIDAKNDSLECIYTGMKRFLPPGLDPTDAVLLNGQPNGINTEHAYPQSKGASGYGRSDMHILYPSRVKTNTVRSNNPFREIPDNETDIWFFNTLEMNSQPLTNKDAYSESTTTFFEPRESSKGDLARSVFYFFTLYNFDAVQADPDFFNLQKADLCSWHFKDPVDSVEWIRNFKISQYQGNLNPFVLDCSLASRLYCDNISDFCRSLSGIKSEIKNSFTCTVYPNPGNGLINLTHPYGPGKMHLKIHSVSGSTLHELTAYTDSNSVVFQLRDHIPGLYFIQFLHENAPIAHLVKYILLP